MDFRYNTAEMQQNPNPNSVISYSHTADYSNNYSYNPNSNPYQPAPVDPHNALVPNQPRPPGVDLPYLPPPAAGQYTQHPVSYETQQVAATAASYYTDANAASAASYYPDPNAASAASYYPDPNAASAAVYYQVDPNASWPAAVEQFGATHAAGVHATNLTIQPQRKNTWKKVPKKTKIVQSAWCEVCKIDCNSIGVLDQHKLGKKHKKNLEKLLAKFAVVPPPAILAAPPATVVVPAPLPVFTSAPIDKPIIGPDKNLAPIDKPIIGPAENPEKPKFSNSQKARKKATNARNEDLESKRRRVLEGGAAFEAVRACNICNVVCNSDTVFNFHLAGQKHASMVKKHALIAAVAHAM